MTVLVLLAAAAHGDVPPDVDLDDLGAWEAGARALRGGPTRCWNLRGTAKVQIALYTVPTLWSRARRHDLVYRGPFEGRIEGGRWQSFARDVQRVDGADPDVPAKRRRATADLPSWLEDLEVPVVPLVGAIDPDIVRRISEPEAPRRSGADAAAQSPSESLNAVDRLLDAIDPATTVSFAGWSDDPRGVRLTVDAPLEDGRNPKVVTMRTFFPDGGDVPTELDVEFPSRWRVGDGMVRPLIMEPQMRIRATAVAGEPLPVAESASMVVGVLGFTLGYEQSLAYLTATRCPSAEAGSSDTQHDAQPETPEEP